MRVLMSALLLIAVAGCSVPPELRMVERFNRSWEKATDPYPGRYLGKEGWVLHWVRHRELRFARLLDDLTALDGCGDHHGCYHILKENQELELWSLLEKLPVYPGEANLLLAAIDDVYLGYHWNGYWGYDWHWPYFNCAKAIQLAERLAKNHPESAEEALWTLIYCYRVGELGDDESSDTTAGKAQSEWKGSAAKARSLCGELIQRYPTGRHAPQAQRLLGLAESEFMLKRPRQPVFGARPLPINLSMRESLGLFTRDVP